MAVPPLLSVENLTVQARRNGAWFDIVDGVSFAVSPQECLGIVGESGSGKTVSVQAVMGLFPRRSMRIAGGHIRFEGRDIAGLPEAELRKIRGREIAMVFQDPMSSLNPVLTIGDQITETLRIHMGLARAGARERAIELLDMVGVPYPAQRIDEYPHRLSGGMRQRVMIALAISCGPKLLIADEPTTALDVTVQKQILKLLDRLRRELGMSIILISHDLAVVAERAERVAVMYAGNIVEEATAGDVFLAPRHPYTEGLVRARPRIDADVVRLASIPGSIPDPQTPTPGCRFNPRCAEATATCRASSPPLVEVAPGWSLRCGPRTVNMTEIA